MSTVTLLINPERWDSDDPETRPHGVAGNVWADRRFWVEHEVEAYYANITDSEMLLSPSDHVQAILCRLAVVLHGEGHEEDAIARQNAWDVVVLVAAEFSSRIWLRSLCLDDTGIFLSGDRPDWNNFSEHVERLRDGRVDNE